jgi:hypothetical protein
VFQPRKRESALSKPEKKSIGAVRFCVPRGGTQSARPVRDGLTIADALKLQRVAISDLRTPTRHGQQQLRRAMSRSNAPAFTAELKKQGTRLKTWSTRKCVVVDKTLTYSHRFGGSQVMKLTQDTLVHLDGSDIHITHVGERQAAVFRAPSRRLAMQLKAALLKEIGWQKRASGGAAAGEGSGEGGGGGEGGGRGGGGGEQGGGRAGGRAASGGGEGGDTSAAADAEASGPEAAAAAVHRDDRYNIEHARSLKLCQAAAEGDLDTIHSLAPSAADVNSTITGGAPLHWACFEGKTECVRQLLKLGASLDVEDRTGMVPAETCVFLGSHNKKSIMKLLARTLRERQGVTRSCAEIVYRLHERHEGVSYASLQRVFLDMLVGRASLESYRGFGACVWVRVCEACVRGGQAGGVCVCVCACGVRTGRHARTCVRPGDMWS